MVLAASSDICQLTKRSPKVPRAGDSATDAQVVTKGQALIVVIQHLHLHPAIVAPTFVGIDYGGGGLRLRSSATRCGMIRVL